MAHCRSATGHEELSGHRNLRQKYILSSHYHFSPTKRRHKPAVLATNNRGWHTLPDVWELNEAWTLTEEARWASSIDIQAGLRITAALSKEQIAWKTRILEKNVPPCFCVSFGNDSESSLHVLLSRRKIVSPVAVAFQSFQEQRQSGYTTFGRAVAILTLTGNHGFNPPWHLFLVKDAAKIHFKCCLKTWLEWCNVVHGLLSHKQSNYELWPLQHHLKHVFSANAFADRDALWIWVAKLLWSGCPGCFIVVPIYFNSFFSLFWCLRNMHLENRWGSFLPMIIIIEIPALVQMTTRHSFLVFFCSASCWQSKDESYVEVGWHDVLRVVLSVGLPAGPGFVWQDRWLRWSPAGLLRQTKTPKLLSDTTIARHVCISKK